MIMKKKKKVDWERRRYEMAAALFFQDIRNMDALAFPHNRMAQWGGLLQCAASDAVMAADIFMREFRKCQQFPMPSEDG